MDNPEVFDRYYNLSIRYLSYRPRSEKEISDYLKTKTKSSPSLSENIIAQIIEKLKSYKFIDDAAFARSWTEQGIKIKHKPIRAVEYELNQKGVDKDIIDECLFKYKDDSSSTDLENARDLKDRKMNYYRALDPKKREEKVMRYLLSKGFSYDVVKKVVKS